MKKAFRYLGIGFFLSALLLFVVYKLNIDFISPLINQAQTTTPTTQATTSSQSVQTTSTTSTTTTQTTSATQTSTTSTVASGSVIEIVVNENDVSYTVAQKLVDAGILSDTREFNKYMGDNNLSRYIQTGRFKIPAGVSLQELGKILTTYPGN